MANKKFLDYSGLTLYDSLVKNIISSVETFIATALYNIKLSVGLDNNMALPEDFPYEDIVTGVSALTTDKADKSYVEEMEYATSLIINDLDVTKQNKLIAGVGIAINPDTNVISASGGSYDDRQIRQMISANTQNINELSGVTCAITQDINEKSLITSEALNYLNDIKQDVLIAGSGITIVDNVISSTASGGSYDDTVVKQAISANTQSIAANTQAISVNSQAISVNEQAINAEVSARTLADDAKLDKVTTSGVKLYGVASDGSQRMYTAGSNVTFNNNGRIDAVDTTYNDGTCITINNKNEINATLSFETNYASLVNMIANNELIPGAEYVFEYNCIIGGEAASSHITSAGHGFSLIVVADSVNTINENARARFKTNDDYFEGNGCNLSSWKIKYCVDNDSKKFSWANPNGYGVIYYMKDEYGNEAPYDFKNIMFPRMLITGGKISTYLINTYSSHSTNSWITNMTVDASSRKNYYTFSYCETPSDDKTSAIDGSVVPYGDTKIIMYKENVIKPLYEKSVRTSDAPNIRHLNDIVFKSMITDEFVPDMHGNYFDVGCHALTFGLGARDLHFGPDVGEVLFSCNALGITIGANTGIILGGMTCQNISISSACVGILMTNYVLALHVRENVKYIAVVSKADDETINNRYQNIVVGMGVVGVDSHSLLALQTDTGLVYETTFQMNGANTIVI